MNEPRTRLHAMCRVARGAACRGGSQTRPLDVRGAPPVGVLSLRDMPPTSVGGVIQATLPSRFCVPIHC
jgi:hypothetical protein